MKMVKFSPERFKARIIQYRWPLLGGLVGLFLLLNRKTIMTAATGAFAAAKLPYNLARWVPNIISAANSYGVSPFILAGIMLRESNGGAALTPANDPAGTGDFIPRWSGAYFKYASPTTGLPPDGRGWGRGLMQLDYGVHNAWAISSAWYDPQVNIDKAASLVKEQMAFFQKASTGQSIYVDTWRLTTGMPQYNIQPWSQRYGVNVPIPSGAAKVGPFRDPRPLSGDALQAAAFAAYNAGPTGVLQALALGLPAEAATTGQDYVSWLSSKMASWTS